MILLVAGALGGCQTSLTDLDRTAQEKAKHLADIELERSVANERFNRTFELPTVVWEQPINHQESCRIARFEDLDGQKDTLYWEGNCQKGRAVGLGRYMVFRNNNLVNDSVVNYQPMANDALKIDAWAYEPHMKRFNVSTVLLKATNDFTLEKFFYRFIPNVFERHDVLVATEVMDSTQKWIHTVFKSSDQIRTTVLFKHDVGVVDSLALHQNDYQKVNQTADMYDRESQKKIGASFYRIHGADWEKTYTFKHSTKDFIEMPDGYWDDFIKRFDGLEAESDEVIVRMSQIGEKARQFVTTYCERSKLLPKGMSRKDYWTICRVNPMLFNVGFNQVLLQNPEKYPILMNEAKKEGTKP